MIPQRISLLFVAAAVVGCGSTPATPDAGVTPDACATCTDGGPDPVDGGSDGGEPDGGEPDGGTEPLPEPVTLSLSEGHDRLYAVTAHEGSFYAAGATSPGVASTDDWSLLLVKLDADGALDTTFGGGDGIVTVNVTEGGRNGEIARGVVVQSSGRIVIAGTAEHDPSTAGVLAADTDVVLVGFEPDGDLDTTFGTDGIARLDLGTATVTVSGGTDVMAGADAQWGLALDSMERLVIHGATRAPGDPLRTDTDYAIVRLTVDGELDATFSTDGVVTMDIGQTNAGARSVTVLGDDSIIGAGYTTAATLARPVGDTVTTSQQPVLWKVTADGELDATFATTDATTTPGVWYDFATPLPGRLNAEAYGAAPLSDGRLVTMGYGRTPIETGMASDLVSFRFSADGDFDTSYGTDGRTYIDVAMLGDNGRHIIALPDDRTLSVGAARPMPPSGAEAEQDAIVVVLSEDGAPDTGFAPGGYRLYDLGGNDHFWGSAVSTDASVVAIVGIAAGVVSGTDDDDAAVLILPVD